MFLVIANNGVAPVQSFTVLGVSTARGNSDKIGQFGSGAKHGINLLLRYGINPKIFLGKDSLEFFSRPEFMGDKQYNRVCYSYKGNVEKTGFSLEFGELDWNNVDMALREIISNAIDAVGFSDMIIDVVSDDKVVGHDNMTTIYLPMTPDIQKFYNNISLKFLHFVGKDTDSIIPNNENRQAKIYRKGVFVRDIGNNYPRSLFDYNLDDNDKIDETRNMTDYQCIISCGRKFANNDSCIEKWMDTQLSNEKFYEDNFPYYQLNANKVLKIFQKKFGDNAVISSGVDFVDKIARKNGKNPINVRCKESLANLDIPKAVDFCNEVEKNGCTVVPTSNELRKNVNKVWRKLETYGLTQGKEIPNVKMFNQVLSPGQSMLFGYYKRGEYSIYINSDQQSSFQTILEELTHYITGAEDETREFQEYAFNIATKVMFNIR